jgi:hypothetical protein
MQGYQVDLGLSLKNIVNRPSKQVPVVLFPGCPGIDCCFLTGYFKQESGSYAASYCPFYRPVFNKQKLIKYE